MCILCVIQKWTRWVAALLPWLVIPLIGLWALSKLLPPDYRFEITSPRLACVIVLLVTLFWYEILMPKLSAWRAQRNVRLRERQKSKAIELQKLRKTATRRCRNCKNPYRDQNPGGGKFMCSYCGHVSKRPVLELPVSPGMGMSDTGLIKVLTGKGGKLQNRWPENGWMCGQDWMENGSWEDGPFPRKSDSDAWRRHGNGMFEGDGLCMTEKSYSCFIVYCCKLLASFILSIRWLWKKIFRKSSMGEDDGFNVEHGGMLAKKRDGVNFHESRSEKARRKADEKKQARLERELLEEEERKQREEVARLVDEQRKLRDEKVEAQKKDTEKKSSPAKDKDHKKEAEKKRLERKKERDRGSNKSNSDGEELEKKLHRESDRKQDSDKQGPPDCRDQKSVIDSTMVQINDYGRGVKSMSDSNASRATGESRYLDRMKGSLLSSSKAVSGGTFFARTANATAATQQEIKPVVALSHVHTSVPKRYSCTPERGKIFSNVEERNSNHLVTMESQPVSASKKSWHQLFTPSPSLTSSSDSLKKANTKCQDEVKTPLSPGHSFSSPSYNNSISFGITSPFSLPSYQSNIENTSLGLSRVVEPSMPRIGENYRDFMQEEFELFEDPCYDPDPLALLGPISQSLDNFQLDMGTGFHSVLCAEKTHVRKSVISPELSKPAPIESPLSRSRGTEDRNPQFSHAPGTHVMKFFPVEDAVTCEQRPWQVWDSTPLLQEDLSLISNPASWLVNRDRNRSGKPDFLQPSSQIRATSLFVEDPSFPRIHVNGGPFSPLSSLNDRDPWVQKTFISPLSDGDNRMPRVPIEKTTQNERSFSSPTESGLAPGTRLPITNSFSNEWLIQGSREGYGKKVPGAERHVRKGASSQMKCP